MPRDIHPDTHTWSRRRLLGTAVATVAVAEVGLVGVARGETASIAKAGPMPGTLKQIDDGVLNVGYVEAGPADGPAVILLHGLPYDIHAFAEVVPILTAAGYRVIIPHLRGYGTTRFLAHDAVRNGEQAALAVDVIVLMDALGIARAVLGGFDWGARTAGIVAALWPVMELELHATLKELIKLHGARGEPKAAAEYKQMYRQALTQREILGVDLLASLSARLQDATDAAVIVD